MTPRPKTGVHAQVLDAIATAIGEIEADPDLERTAVNLARQAGTSRPTLYRAFTDRPDLRAAFERLTITSRDTRQRVSQDDRRIHELRAENRRLRNLIAALATTTEALRRENTALRGRLGAQSTVSPLPTRTAR
jgi:septal ring factor EnvC (AmiA/AmiB activator)